MSFVITFYSLGLFLGALVSGCVAVVAWRRAGSPVGRSLALLMTAVFQWSLCAAFESAVTDTARKVLLSKLEYLGIAATPVLMLLFALRFARSGSRPARGWAAALWAIPAATVLLAATNESHGLIWARVSPAPEPFSHLLIYEHGTFFWVHVAYSYLLLAATTVSLVLAYFQFKDISRRQALIILLAFPWPWLGNILYLSGLLAPGSGRDFTPLGFALAGCFLLWAIFELHLVDIVPVAREKVIESMGEALVILDERGRAAALNPAARRLLAELGGPSEGVPEKNVLGRRLDELFVDWPELAAALRSPSPGHRELVRQKDGTIRAYDLHLSPLLGHRSRVSGWVAALYDISRLKEAEAEAVEARKVAETLQEAGLTLTSTLDLREVSRLILDLIGRLIRFEVGAFLMAEGAELRLAAVKGPEDGGTLVGRTFPVTGCQLCHMAVQRRRPLISAITAPEDILLPPGTVSNGPRSYLGIPIVYREHVTGLLALYDPRPNAFSQQDARVAELFAGQVAIALENSRLFEERERQAVTDTLTGLYNRRAFFDTAEKEVVRARRYQRPLSLILFDIDHFKAVNDTYGHLIGDQVLRVLSSRVKKAVRSTDFVCRYGGEEFLVLMPECDRDEALAMAERLRQIASEMTVVTAGGSLSLTISLGVASLSSDGDESVEALINRADRAMYEAKAAGRNAVRG